MLTRAQRRAASRKGGLVRAERLRAARAATQAGSEPYPGTMLDLMDAAGLVGPSWAAWRTFWRVVGGGSLSPAERALVRRCTGRQQAPAGPLRELYVLAGRRSGKSRNAALLAFWTAIRRRWSDLLAPGEVARIPLLGADRRQARQLLGYIRGLCALPPFQPYVRTILKDSVTFTSGAMVEVHAATFRLVRGFSMPAAVLDEACFLRTEEGAANVDSEVVNALQPALATLPGSVLALFSTPWSAAGVMYGAWERVYGQPVGDALFWRADSRTMNPTLDAATIARAYERDAVSAASEFGAEWRHDVEAYVAEGAVRAVTPDGVRERAPVPGTTYTAFADAAGGGGTDAFTLSLAHVEQGRAILDLCREWRPRFSPAAVIGEIAELLRTYHVGALTADRFAAGFAAEAFAAAGLRYTPCDQSTSELYRSAVGLINSGTVELLAVPRLIQQLVGLERRAVGTGREIITHVRGGHDDLATSCCGALVLAAAKLRRAPNQMPWFPGQHPGPKVATVIPVRLGAHAGDDGRPRRAPADPLLAPLRRRP